MNTLSNFTQFAVTASTQSNTQGGRGRGFEKIKTKFADFAATDEGATLINTIETEYSIDLNSMIETFEPANFTGVWSSLDV